MSSIDLTSTEIGIEALTSSLFSALQPLFSLKYSPTQVKSLLVLALLFWQKPTFSDTQIGDNPHLFHEFLRPAGQTLAPLIQNCLASGEARLLLCDAFYVNPYEKLLDCSELIDVYRGWQMQGLPGAWVVPPGAPNRGRYIETWNRA